MKMTFPSFSSIRPLRKVPFSRLLFANVTLNICIGSTASPAAKLEYGQTRAYKGKVQNIEFCNFVGRFAIIHNLRLIGYGCIWQNAAFLLYSAKMIPVIAPTQLPTQLTSVGLYVFELCLTQPSYQKETEKTDNMSHTSNDEPSSPRDEDIMKKLKEVDAFMGSYSVSRAKNRQTLYQN